MTLTRKSDEYQGMWQPDNGLRFQWALANEKPTRMRSIKAPCGGAVTGFATRKALPK